MHTHEILEPIPLPIYPHLEGEVVGDWSWVPYRNIDEQTLFLWLESADMQYDLRWHAKLIREELKRRRGVWEWWV